MMSMMIDQAIKAKARNVIPVALALVLVAAAPPERAPSNDHAREQSPNAQAPRGIKQPLRRWCKVGEDGDRTSDLCAQWKAADAASDATVWAGRSFYLGLVGALLAALTMAAAIAAAKFARDAALHTKRSADEAERSATAAADGIGVSMAAIGQSSDQFSATNRPWLAIENVTARYCEGLDSAVPSSVTCIVMYELVNYGNMPALAVNSSAGLSEFDIIAGVPELDVGSALARASMKGAVIFPTERRTIGRLDGRGGASGLGFAQERESILLGVRIVATYRGSNGTAYLTGRDCLICTPGSSETRMGNIMFATLGPDLVDAAIVDVRGGNAIV